MKLILKIINNYIIKDYSTRLGRWNLNICQNKIKSNIDLANEDHCGPCGQYNNSKIIKLKKIKNK